MKLESLSLSLLSWHWGRVSVSVAEREAGSLLGGGHSVQRREDMVGWLGERWSQDRWQAAPG